MALLALGGGVYFASEQGVFDDGGPLPTAGPLPPGVGPNLARPVADPRAQARDGSGALPGELSRELSGDEPQALQVGSTPLDDPRINPSRAPRDDPRLNPRLRPPDEPRSERRDGVVE